MCDRLSFILVCTEIGFISLLNKFNREIKGLKEKDSNSTLWRPLIDLWFPGSFPDHFCRVGREVNKNKIKILFFIFFSEPEH